MNTENSALVLPEFGSPDFWLLYDELCSKEGLTKLINEPNYQVAKIMNQVATAAHRTRAIHTLSRLDHGWKYHNAWFALRYAHIQNHNGDPFMNIRPCDVVVVEHGWDRDVIITHTPIETERVAGYLLSGKWEPMIGLFLPLFDAETIHQAIELRLEENANEARELAQKEAKDWGWYPKNLSVST